MLHILGRSSQKQIKLSCRPCLLELVKRKSGIQSVLALLPPTSCLWFSSRPTDGGWERRVNFGSKVVREVPTVTGEGVIHKQPPKYAQSVGERISQESLTTSTPQKGPQVGKRQSTILRKMKIPGDFHPPMHTSISYLRAALQ
jgi:hypothetical protein